MNGIGRDLVEIASLIIGLAMVGMIIRNSSDTANVINAATGGFSNLLSTATFQGGNQYNF